MNKVTYFIGILFIAGIFGQYLNAESADTGQLVSTGAGVIGSIHLSDANEPIKEVAKKVVSEAGKEVASGETTNVSKNVVSYWQKGAALITGIKNRLQPGLTMIGNASVSTYNASGRLLSHLYKGKENEVSILTGGVQLGVGCYAGDVVGREICHMTGIDPVAHPIATEIIQKGSMVGGGIASLVAHDAGYNICNHPYLLILLSIIACKGDNALSRIKNAIVNNRITSGFIAAGVVAYSYAQGLDISVLGRSFIENGQCNPLASIKDMLLESPWKSVAIVGGVLGLVGCYKSFYKAQMRKLLNIQEAILQDGNAGAMTAYENAASYRNVFGFKTDYYTEALKQYYAGVNNISIGATLGDKRSITRDEMLKILWGVETI